MGKDSASTACQCSTLNLDIECAKNKISNKKYTQRYIRPDETYLLMGRASMTCWIDAMDR